MRLWHKDLIPVLPKKQLLGQWRECCAIAKNIFKKGTPNHLLVNRIMDYPLEHFAEYTAIVGFEMLKRGYAIEPDKVYKYVSTAEEYIEIADIFPKWHDDQYLLQCFYNLQEKFDCGGLTDEEYDKIHKLMISKGFRV